MNPTKEQIQWFWEQCGIKYMGDGRWLYPDGVIHWQAPPSIGSLEFLGFLFEYAVPKLTTQGCIVTLEIYPNGKACCQLLPRRTSQHTYKEHKDPALALFWAIYKAFGGKQ